MRSRLFTTTAIVAALAGSLIAAEANAGSTTSNTTVGTTTATGAAASTGSTASVSTGAVTQQQPNELRARRILGTDIYNSAREDIGEIEDLVFDDKGQITSAIVAVGGFLGIGEKWVAVPWNQVQWSTDDRNNRRASLNMTKDQLKNAPAFQTAEEMRRDADSMRARMDAGRSTTGTLGTPSTGVSGTTTTTTPAPGVPATTTR